LTMLQKPLLMLAMLGAVTITVGCETSPSTNGHDLKSVVDPIAISQAISFDDPTLVEPATLLLNDGEAVEALGSDVVSQLAESVDFETQSLLVIALGTQDTAGYGVAILDAQQKANTLYVRLHVTEPAEVGAVAQTITHPAAAAVIAKSDAELIQPESMTH